MHAEVLSFASEIFGLFPRQCQGHILEIGSLDVNGSVRQFFPEAQSYTGVDLGPGRGVDVVGRFHEFPWEPESFDVVVSTEALEHDSAWSETLAAAYEILLPGGLILLTWASPGRGVHYDGNEPSHYEELTVEQVVAALKGLGRDGNAADPTLAYFSEARGEVVNPCTGTFWGIKL